MMQGDACIQCQQMIGVAVASPEDFNWRERPDKLREQTYNNCGTQ